jgi:hypothetical protein
MAANNQQNNQATNMSIRIKLSLLALITIVFISGCAGHSGQRDQQPDPRPFTACTEPRPQICTMEYNPVCAKLGNTRKTYATGCTACSDPDVSGHYPGECQ